MGSFLLICLFFLLVLVKEHVYSITVKTKYGNIVGLTTPKGNAFLGIPYALPPVGERRWRDPEDAIPWSPRTLYAQHFSPACPQKDCEIMNPAIMCPKTTSEDCLYLNVWTPLSANATSQLPVMVFIHGGNFDHMFAGALVFHGENIADRGNVIVVSMDYRIGALGFLLTADHESSGNFAIKDQRLALKWVNENIKDFGGDPAKVTVFGQSAGGQSITVHLMTKDSAQYFSKAIIQSAPIALPFRTENEMIFLSNMLATKLNCTENMLSCLRGKTPDEITTAQLELKKYPSSVNILDFFEPWVPYVDGVVVPSQPLSAAKHGYFVPMPIMIGSMTEDTRPYIYEGFQKAVMPLKYAALLAALKPSKSLEILEMYPPPSSADERDALEIPATDFVFTCSIRNYTRNAARKNDGNTWRYVYSHPFSFVKAWGHLTFCTGHVCHGSELPILFRTASLYNFTMTSDELKLSDDLIRYWTNFARNGNPNVGANISVNWPQYHENDSNYMRLDIQSRVESNYRKDYCDFWDNIGF